MSKHAACVSLFVFYEVHYHFQINICPIHYSCIIHYLSVNSLIYSPAHPIQHPLYYHPFPITMHPPTHPPTHPCMVIYPLCCNNFTTIGKLHFMDPKNIIRPTQGELNILICVALTKCILHKLMHTPRCMRTNPLRLIHIVLRISASCNSINL